jgi:hypothetical protein
MKNVHAYESFMVTIVMFWNLKKEKKTMYIKNRQVNKSSKTHVMKTHNNYNTTNKILI